MKKTILTISVIAGLTCGNAMATPTGQSLQTALSTCQTTSSCPSPTGVLFNTAKEAEDFLIMMGFPPMMWGIESIMIGEKPFYAVTQKP
jgi:hypothetical protein